jgi:cytochrome c oxidase assembly protein subunit 15
MTPFDPWRHRFAVLTAVSTLALIFIGGLVTSTGSGLAVPDWPLSYGMLMPPMVGGVFYEHGHRMAASFVGFLTLVLAVWTWRSERRRGVRRLGWLALFAVMTQGLLGGLTVLFLLPTPISVTHACLAQTFLCLTVALAYSTSREWLSAAPRTIDAAGVRTAAFTAAAVVYTQLVLGALMRHRGAGLAIPDFPLAFGRLIPSLEDARVAIHYAHRVGALAVFFALARLLWTCVASRQRRFALMGSALFALVLLQIALGAATVLTGKAVTPTTLHVATGAAILAGSFLTALRAWRMLERPEPQVAPAAIADAARS